jgi:hypothetical protein
MSYESLPSFATVFGEDGAQSMVQSFPVYAQQEAYQSGKWTLKVDAICPHQPLKLSIMRISNILQEETNFHNAVHCYGLSNINAIQAAVGTRSRSQIRNRIQKVKTSEMRSIKHSLLSFMTAVEGEDGAGGGGDETILVWDFECSLTKQS